MSTKARKMYLSNFLLRPKSFCVPVLIKHELRVDGPVTVFFYAEYV